MAAATPVADFCGVISESKKIMKAHSRHFLGLSVLFLLPISFILVYFPTLRLSIITTDPDSLLTQTLLRYTSPHLHHHPRVALKSLFICLLLAVFVLTFSLCAAASITYSVYHGFFGRPVKFVYAIKSLSTTLLRLLVTVLCAKLILFAVTVVFAAVAFLLIRGIEFLGFQVSYSVVCVIGLVVLGLVLVYAQVNWSLACAVVVAESIWGLEPLRRSAYLVKGLRGLALSLVLYFGGVGGFVMWGSWGYGLGSGVLRALIFVLYTVGASACLMVLLLYSVAANTVLYMYCKALHGELAMEIAEEFAQEYLTLPFDDEKVPHVVSVIQR